MSRAALVLIPVLFFLSPATAADSETDRILVELLRDLKSKDADTRARAAMMIGTLGKAAEKAVPNLFAAADDDDDDVRKSAMESLACIAHEVPAALDALISLLKHKRADVRAEAASKISWLGSKAKKAIPALGTAALDKDDEVAKSAIHALGGLAEKHPAAVRALCVALHEGSPTGVDWALTEISALEKAGEVPQRVLLKLLSDDRWEIWFFALYELQRRGTDGEVAKVLAGLVRGDGGKRDRAYILGLGRLGRTHPEAVTALRSLLRKEKKTRDRALFALYAAGAGAKPAVPELLELLKCDDPDVQGQVIVILGNIQGAAAAVPDLRRFLSHDDKSLRAAAAWALAAVGKSAAPAGPELERETQAEWSLLRAAAGYALFRVTGKLPDGTVKALIESANEETDRVISALADIGPAAKEAVPVLEGLTTHKYYAEEAKAALARIRGE